MRRWAVRHTSVPFHSLALSLVLSSTLPIHAEEAERKQERAESAFVDMRDRLKIGDTIYVTEFSGAVIKGKIQNFSWEEPALTLEDPERLSIDSRGESHKNEIKGLFHAREANARRIEVEVPDSLANGALIGLGVGATPGLLALAFGKSEASAYGGYYALFWGGIGAALGALIDNGTKSKRTLYSVPEGRSLQIQWSPILSRDGKGISVSIQF